MDEELSLDFDCKCDMCPNSDFELKLSITKHPDGNFGIRIKTDNSTACGIVLSPADILELATFAGVLKKGD